MANLIRWDPFQDLQDLQKTFFGSSLLAGSNMSVPVSDVYLEGNQLVVEAQLPNFNESEVDIRVHSGVLEIRADHKESEERGKKDRKYVVRESSSSFYRSIALPSNAQENKIEAHFDKGMLRVVAPLKPKPQSKKITVKVGKNKK